MSHGKLNVRMNHTLRVKLHSEYKRTYEQVKDNIVNANETEIHA